MPAFVALLRGVNVGKAKRVAMATWRAQLEALGYTEVATLLNSGNAVFRAKAGAPNQHGAAIAAALERGFGFGAAVVVKSAADVDAIVAENPYTAAPEPARLLIAYTADAKALAALGALAHLARAPDQFTLGRHAAYVHCVGGILESPLASAMLGKAGAAATTRNWATTLKLKALLDARR